MNQMNCSLENVYCSNNSSSITSVINETLIDLISCNDSLSLCKGNTSVIMNTTEPDQWYIDFR